MAALEPTRKKLTSFTIESIVGRSSPSFPKPRPLPSSGQVDDCRSHDRASPARKSASRSGSVTTSTSTGAVPGATSAGRHLELLARFAAPNLTGSNSSSLSTAAVFGSCNAGAASLAEALLRVGGHLPYPAVQKLVNHGNSCTGPPMATRLQGQTSTLEDGTAGPAALLRATVWNPQDLAPRLPPQSWSTSLVLPLTTGVRATSGHTYMHHPYAGKYFLYRYTGISLIKTRFYCNTNLHFIV